MYNLFRVASFIQHNDFMIHYYYYSLLHVAIVRSLLSHIILQRNTSLYIHLPVEGYLHCFQILIIILKDSLTFEYRFLCVNKFTTLKYYLTWLYIYLYKKWANCFPKQPSHQQHMNFHLLCIVKFFLSFAILKMFTVTSLWFQFASPYYLMSIFHVFFCPQYINSDEASWHHWFLVFPVFLFEFYEHFIYFGCKFSVICVIYKYFLTACSSAKQK